MINVVYAQSSGPIDLPGGGRVTVRKGAHWPADDPAVRARPDMFSTDPRWGMDYTTEPDGYDAPIDDVPIEAASAVPGEKRSVRRN